MTHDGWDKLLAELRQTHKTVSALQAFCAFPDDPRRQDIAPHHIPAADLMYNDPDLSTDRFTDLRDALIDAAPLAQWRETYRNTVMGPDFLDRFGCYEIIGQDAPFACEDMRSFVVYAPPGLYYPWHHHPAEELYLVIAGEAEFALEGAPPQILRPGDTVFHPSSRPHAMTTHASPVMAYVLWRGDLETKPVFTYPEAAQ